jgi:hypothetical protein
MACLRISLSQIARDPVVAAILARGGRDASPEPVVVPVRFPAMSAGADEDLARSINCDFDRLVDRQRRGGISDAVQAARAAAFAAVAFLEQAVGRQVTLLVIEEMIDG